jgi:hypothetical protein
MLSSLIKRLCPELACGWGVKVSIPGRPNPLAGLLYTHILPSGQWSIVSVYKMRPPENSENNLGVLHSFDQELFHDFHWYLHYF